MRTKNFHLRSVLSAGLLCLFAGGAEASDVFCRSLLNQPRTTRTVRLDCDHDLDHSPDFTGLIDGHGILSASGSLALAAVGGFALGLPIVHQAPRPALSSEPLILPAQQLPLLRGFRLAPSGRSPPSN